MRLLTILLCITCSKIEMDVAPRDCHCSSCQRQRSNRGQSGIGGATNADPIYLMDLGLSLTQRELCAGGFSYAEAFPATSLKDNSLPRDRFFRGLPSTHIHTTRHHDNGSLISNAVPPY